MKKKFKSLGRFSVRLMIAAVVFVFMILVRLAYAPTPVGMLGDTIVQPFEAAFPDRTFSYDGAYLEWSWEQAAFQFSLEDIHIDNLDGTPFAEFPKLAVTFDGIRLLVGTYIPERVDIYGPEIHLDWDSEVIGGRIEKALFDPDEDLPKPEDLERPPVVRFMEAMLKGEGENSPLKDLKVVNIREATITLIERNLGVVWQMPDGDIEISRAARGLALSADLNLETTTERVAFSVQSEETGDGLTKVELSMQGLNLAKLADEVALGKLFKAVRMPLYGTVTLWQNETGGINLLDFDLGGGPGTIFYERLNTEPARFEDVVFKGTLDPAESLISLEDLSLGVDGDTITGDGFIEFTAEDRAPALRMVLSSDRLKVSTFLQLWPTAKRSGGRDWIAANVDGATLTNVKAELAFLPDTWGQKPLPSEAMHISLDFEDADVHFLRPMPPFEDARGHMLLEGNEMHATVYEGVVDGTRIENLRFDIQNLTKSKAQMGHAVFRVGGDLQKLMRFIDLDPLNIFIKQGLDPADYFGAADMEVRLTVPLYSGAPEDATDYTIEGTIKDAAVPTLLAGGGLTEGEMTMTITPEGLVSQGNALLKGVPFDFYWTQDFKSESEADFTTRVELSGNLTDDHLHTFGLPDDLTMVGTARVYMSLKGRDGNLVSGQGTGDFFKAKVEAAKMDWHKDANRRADAKFDLEWTDTELYVKNAIIDSREFKFRGGFIFDNQTGLMKRADIPVYVTPATDMTATARLMKGGVLEVTVNAKAFNAASYLDTMFEDTGEESFAPDMHLIFMGEIVQGLNGVTFHNLSIDADKRREYWIEANLIGGIDQGGAFQLALVNDAEGRHMTLESDNGGRLALGTDVFRNATGGKLLLNADMNVYQDPLYAKGTLSASDFVMVKSSILIEALAEDERSGLDEMIREGGINFSEVEIPFVLENEIFDISDAHARGNAMGFTMEGEVDEGFTRMNLNGTVVPAYSLNTFISRIPIIGTIIAGGTGEGLFALNYRITGTREEPNVDFKEMSAVAPGIFRKILGSQKKGKLEPEPAPQPEETGADDGEGTTPAAETPVETDPEADVSPEQNPDTETTVETDPEADVSPEQNSDRETPAEPDPETEDEGGGLE